MTAGNGSNGGGPASGAPKGPITDTMSKPLAKRFYKAASAGDGAPFPVLLDGRAVKTPAKRMLVLPARACAEAVAAEWNAQTEFINPAAMPLTRFANTAIDAVSGNLADVANDIVSYAGRDLLCYRAESPPDLAAQQAAQWDPVINWLQTTLAVRLVVVSGVMPVDQPPEALDVLAAALAPHDAFRLTALHVMTTLTGSALLAIAHARGFLSADAAWAAAHVDEDYQIGLWGQDEAAAERRAKRQTEFHAACKFLAMVQAGK